MYLAGGRAAGRADGCTAAVKVCYVKQVGALKTKAMTQMAHGVCALVICQLTFECFTTATRPCGRNRDVSISVATTLLFASTDQSVPHVNSVAVGCSRLGAWAAGVYGDCRVTHCMAHAAGVCARAGCILARAQLHHASILCVCVQLS